MGKRGPAPKPKVINDLKGDPHKRRRHMIEPEPPKARPKCPEHLGEVAKQEWDFVTEQLDKMGLLSVADRTALELYCLAYERFRTMEKLSKTTPFVKNSKGNWDTPPWVRQMRQAEDSCRRWLIEFGLTPAGRSRLAVQKETAAKSGILNFVAKKSA